MFWIIVILSLMAATAVGFIYLLTRIHKFTYFQHLAEQKKLRSWLLAVLPLVPLGVYCLLDYMNGIVCALHLVAIWLLCDICNFVLTKCRKKAFQRYYAGGLALLITVVYLAIGRYLAYHVVRTDYAVEADKDIGGTIRVVQIADSHLGTTFDGETFAGYIAEIQNTEPDLLVLTGDFVDDDSCRADMERSCEALGNLKTTYGIYFVFGNHDKGYRSDNYRDFNEQDLRDCLTAHGVRILEDESICIDDRFYLIGRQDRSVSSRADMASLVKEVDDSKYMLVLDHQPNDYDAEQAAQVDLVLSGHTHGGQVFPVGPISVISKTNDKYYGKEKRGNTTFIVTSGISDWAIRFKTATVSEYVVIDIGE